MDAGGAGRRRGPVSSSGTIAADASRRNAGNAENGIIQIRKIGP